MLTDFSSVNAGVALVVVFALLGVGCADDGGTTGASASTSTSTSTSGGSEASTTDASSSSMTGESSTTAVGPVCGDGAVDAGEECDDGNSMDGDGCNNDCMPSGRELWVHLESPPVIASVAAIASKMSERGEVVVVGGFVDEGTGNDAWLARVDPKTGAMLWSKRFDFDADERVHGLTIVGDEVIAAGTQRGADRDVLLFGASDAGELGWHEVLVSVGEDYATAIATVGNGAVATGLVTTEGGVQIWAQRVEAGGALGWTRTYPWVTVTLYPLGPGVAGFSDRAVIANSRKTDVVSEALIALDLGGAELWTTVLDEVPGTIQAAAPAMSGGIFTASKIVPNGLAVRSFAADGASVWGSIDCAGLNGRGVAEGPDGTIAVIGLAEGSTDDIRLCKLSSSAKLMWERTLDSGGDDYGYAVAVLSDGTVLAGGDWGASQGVLAAFSP
jgi:cysteine-rich repeat protein